MARGLLEGTRYQITGFRVGSYGFNPANPGQPLAIDAADTELRGVTFPALSATPEPIDKLEYANAQAPSFLCRVAADEAVRALGEWGIYATITYSTDAAEIGTRVLFALSHRPMVGKTLDDVLVWRLIVQF